MKMGSFVVIAAALFLVVSMPSTAGAYGGATHEWVVRQGFDLFKCPGPEPCTCPTHSYPELEVTNWFNDILVALGCEDSHDHNGWNYEVTTGTHFWDGDNDDEFVKSTMPFTGDYENAMDNARRLLKQARELYLNNQKVGENGEGGAYDLLSHAIHLIADMTVPAHAHVNPHALNGLDADAGDSYDDWVGYDDDTFGKIHARWTANDARAAGGLVAIPNDALAVYTSLVQNNNDGLWPDWSDNHQLGADFYYLIYTANQYGDYFGSMGFIPKDCAVCPVTGDGDGNSDDRRGWMNYGAPPFTNVNDPPLTQDRLLDNSKMLYCTPSNICPVMPWVPCPLNDPCCWQFWGSVNDDDGDLSKIASVNLVYAYRAAATLIKSFRDSIDNIPPVTKINLAGTAGHDGWFRSDVLMTFSATDNSDGTVWAPNLTMSQWREVTAPADCWIDTPYSHTFYAEGVRQIHYRSIDGLGNEETPLPAAIKIDKTNPVISITSPDKDGFYLTTGSLQIIFDVSDPISGVYSKVAKLDGNVVSNLQVFDLSAMGGWHTFTVEAEDYAGNKMSQSVVFSIKIDATITVNPIKINSKSNSDPVTTYIEFPAGYDVGQINVPQTSLSPRIGWLLMASPSPTGVGDSDHDRVPDRMVKFNRQDFITAVEGATGNTNVIVQGELFNETEFYGTSTVLVTNPGK